MLNEEIHSTRLKINQNRILNIQITEKAGKRKQRYDKQKK